MTGIFKTNRTISFNLLLRNENCSKIMAWQLESHNFGDTFDPFISLSCGIFSVYNFKVNIIRRWCDFFVSVDFKFDSNY